MLQNITRFFLRTTTGRILLAVGLAMGVAYLVRLAVVDAPANVAKEAAQVGAQTLDAMADRLTEANDSPSKPTLPAITQWYPADIPCGADAQWPQPRDPVWDLLGLPTDDSRTAFQYRFRMLDEDAFEILARRDSDCDGHYAIWRLEDGGTRVLGRDVTAQNVLE